MATDDELCMLCNAGSKPGEDLILCIVCQAPWHQTCLIFRCGSHFISNDYPDFPECQICLHEVDLETLAPMYNSPSSFSAQDNSMDAKILGIQVDTLLMEEEKARKRPKLFCGKSVVEPQELEANGEKPKVKTTVVPDHKASKVSDGSFNCFICLNM